MLEEQIPTQLSGSLIRSKYGVRQPRLQKPLTVDIFWRGNRRRRRLLQQQLLLLYLSWFMDSCSPNHT